jgi:hypothetical protein
MQNEMRAMRSVIPTPVNDRLWRKEVRTESTNRKYCSVASASLRARGT